MGCKSPTMLNICNIMTDNKSQTVEKISIKEDVTPPRLYKVIFFNDEITTVEFVISVLMSIFGYKDIEALNLTNQIHQNGSSVVAILPFELAEQKALESTLMARNNNFPLIVKVEMDA